MFSMRCIINATVLHLQLLQILLQPALALSCTHVLTTVTPFKNRTRPLTVAAEKKIAAGPKSLRIQTPIRITTAPAVRSVTYSPHRVCLR